MNKPEILAPAGSYDAFLAAVHNGCDAVYLGGKAYGARAYADNFDLDTLKRAVTYAAGFGVKVYYTINTLFKEKELPDLVAHLGDVLNTGVHALIVQDLGVVKVINDHYPGTEIHISTQMNCHSLEGIRYLADQGVSRVVLGRELNIDEIKHIREHSNLELEAFVHGALCYCYSGQCLMSSFLGGRSGNRGRCAQPCRLGYKGIIDGEVHDTSHVLSPKDIETLSILPEVIDAGIHSLKIEGRMKSPEYVGLMTALYKKYRDLYLEKGAYVVEQKDMDEVRQTFNRGDFSQGYYGQHNGKAMITHTQPKNQGVEVGKCLEQKGRQVLFKTEVPLAPGDCIEFALVDGTYESVILQSAVKGNGSLKIKGTVKRGSSFRRIKSMALTEELQRRNQRIDRQGIVMEVSLLPGAPAVLTVKGGVRAVTVTGDEVQEAQKQGLTQEKVVKQLSKTGELPLMVEGIDISMPDNAFMAVSQLNALRRKAFDELIGSELKVQHTVATYVSKNSPSGKTTNRNITVLSNNRYQIETVMAYDIKRVYLEWVNFSSEDIRFVLQQPKVLAGEVEVWLAVPRITRYEKQKQLEQLFSTYDQGIAGFLVRSIDSYGHIKAYGKPVRWDYGMNLMNTQAVAKVMEVDGSQGYMPSLELKYGELKALDHEKSEIMIYGHVKSMISAQCVRQTLEGCRVNQGAFLHIEDRKGVKVPVETNCLLCYNIIYNGTPIYLGDRMDKFQALGVSDYRLDFVMETKEEIKKLMDGVSGQTVRSADQLLTNFTRGHYNKGVE